MSRTQQIGLIATGHGIAVLLIMTVLVEIGMSVPGLLAVATALVVMQIVHTGLSIVAAILLAAEELVR